MENSSYQNVEIFILKAVGPSRVVLFFMLPFTLLVDFLAFMFYFVTNLFSPNLKKITLWFFEEIKGSIIKGVTGKFEVDQSGINSKQYKKLIAGKTIDHPLYGKCRLIESHMQNFRSGKTKKKKVA